MREKISSLVTSKSFEVFIAVIILINSLFIGIETYGPNPQITLCQDVILGIFTVEILLRMFIAKGVKDFFSNGWNIFDLTLVLIGYIPESFFSDASTVMAIRVLRVFRVLRLLRVSKEIKVIIAVLVKSLSALFYNILFFGIFLYLFAIVGVGLFRMPDRDTLTPDLQERYDEFLTVAPNAPANAPAPFDDLGEACFTLFRELTGEDWTDVRYNQITAHEYGLISASPTIITTYHILWFVFSAFLMLNLIVGAIVNNYQMAMDEANEPTQPTDPDKKE